MASLNSPLGLCILPAPARNAARTSSYPAYIRDILNYAGFCFADLEEGALQSQLSSLSVLVTAGEKELAEPMRQALQKWVEDGGCWISVAGCCGMQDLFGVSVEKASYSLWGAGPSTLGEGYMQAAECDESRRVLTAHLRIPLHFFGGIPVKAEDATVLARVLNVHQHQTERVALTEKLSGKGRCVLIAPDIAGSVVLMQQGTAVGRDRPSAPDGTAGCSDDVLKSDDGSVLDWIFDRQPVNGVPGFSAFLEPVADQWKELLIRSILYCASAQKLTIPLLWFYPRNLHGVAVMSHDSDQNEPDKAQGLLDALASVDIHSTWCIQSPGYPQDTVSNIRLAGHELAMHYDAMSDGRDWGEEQFENQWRRLTQVFSGEKPVTNKNHYLRWEGDMELFDWCVKRGIRMDQSKGASKTGEAGFNFGTCHPYRPVRADGTAVKILEMTTPTQDLEIFAPSALFPQLLDGVLRSYGVLHLLFHPAHIFKPGVREAIETSVSQARLAGMEWWTVSQLTAWLEARSQTEWLRCASGEGRCFAQIRTVSGLQDATILWLDPDLVPRKMRFDATELQAVEVARWGFRFQAVAMPAAEPGRHELIIEGEAE